MCVWERKKIINRHNKEYFSFSLDKDEGNDDDDADNNVNGVDDKDVLRKSAHNSW